MVKSDSFFAYSDFFFFYCDRPLSEPLKENTVVKRYKKDPDSFAKLQDFVDMFEENDFKTSLQNFIDLQKIVPLRYVGGNLVELRFKNPHWRILAYLSKPDEMIIMIDAKIVHQRHDESEISELARAHNNEIKAIERELEEKRERRHEYGS